MSSLKKNSKPSKVARVAKYLKTKVSFLLDFVTGTTLFSSTFISVPLRSECLFCLYAIKSCKYCKQMREIDWTQKTGSFGFNSWRQLYAPFGWKQTPKIVISLPFQLQHHNIIVLWQFCLSFSVLCLCSCHLNVDSVNWYFTNNLNICTDVFFIQSSCTATQQQRYLSEGWKKSILRTQTAKQQQWFKNNFDIWPTVVCVIWSASAIGFDSNSCRYFTLSSPKAMIIEHGQDRFENCNFTTKSFIKIQLHFLANIISCESFVAVFFVETKYFGSIWPEFKSWNNCCDVCMPFRYTYFEYFCTELSKQNMK